MRERLRAAEKSKSAEPDAVIKLETKVAELERRLGEGNSNVSEAGLDSIDELRERLTDIEGVLAITQEEASPSVF